MLPRDPFTTADAITAGYSPTDIRDQVVTGSWRRLRLGVYCTALGYTSTGWDPRRRYAIHVRAAQLAVPRPTVASGWSAAWLNHLPMPPELDGKAPDGVTLTTAIGRGRQLSGIDLISAPLPDDHIWQEHEVAVTSPARTAVDLALTASMANALAVVDAVLHRGCDTTSGLLAILDELQRRPGRIKAQEIIQLGNSRTESPLESHSRAFFVSAGLPLPESQVEIRDSGELVGRVDFLWRDRRTIGEADGRLKYLDADALYQEKRREDRLRDLGFEVVRWSFADLRHGPQATSARIRAAFVRGTRPTMAPRS